MAHTCCTHDLGAPPAHPLIRLLPQPSDRKDSSSNTCNHTPATHKIRQFPSTRNVRLDIVYSLPESLTVAAATVFLSNPPGCAQEGTENPWQGKPSFLSSSTGAIRRRSYRGEVEFVGDLDFIQVRLPIETVKIFGQPWGVAAYLDCCTRPVETATEPYSSS